MSQTTKIDSPITIKDNTDARVAFDLMTCIVQAEGLPNDAVRKYYLTLYRQCLKAVVRKGDFSDIE